MVAAKSGERLDRLICVKRGPKKYIYKPYFCYPCQLYSQMTNIDTKQFAIWQIGTPGNSLCTLPGLSLPGRPLLLCEMYVPCLCAHTKLYWMLSLHLRWPLSFILLRFLAGGMYYKAHMLFNLTINTLEICVIGTSKNIIYLYKLTRSDWRE